MSGHQTNAVDFQTCQNLHDDGQMQGNVGMFEQEY